MGRTKPQLPSPTYKKKKATTNISDTHETNASTTAITDTQDEKRSPSLTIKSNEAATAAPTLGEAATNL